MRTLDRRVRFSCWRALLREQARGTNATDLRRLSTHKNQNPAAGTRSDLHWRARTLEAFVSELEHRDLAKNQKLQLKSTSLLLQRNNNNYTAPVQIPDRALKN